MDIELGEGNNEVKAGDIRMQEIAMGDQTKQSTEYLAGVVEGFYGAPWTEGQRKHLIKNMTEYHLNTYVYAPKDDRKHRADWRALYDPVECETLKSLIDCCKESGVIFIYTLSPGIDIVYSSKTERQLLVEKFQQMQNMGATGFGLLFDDIEAVMDTDDSLTYDHVASAQSEITNYVYGILGRPKYFLFCPTEYSTSRADPNLFDSKYLNILGQTLESDIMILWTGPRVISKMIPIDHIRNVTRIFNRPPVIWDNLHANDYDRRNVFMGPYKNRHLELCHLTKGIFLNPNCQYDLNYVPIRSFGMFVDAAFKCCPPKDSSKSLNSSSLSLDHGDYDPNRVFKDCCRLWAEDIKKSTSTLLPSDSNCESCLEGSNEHIHLGVALDESSKCTFKDKDKYPKQIDLYRVASFFYLPGEFGPLVNDIYRAFDILARNSINKWQKKVNDRFNAHTALENYKVSFKSLCDKVVSSTKTILRSHSLYIRPEILPFVMEIRESIHLMRSYVKYLETNNVNDDSVSDPDTIVNRTRFYTEIQVIRVVTENYSIIRFQRYCP
ncbi:Protein O-GlcNAcase [Thelohanellus kitauei]|uniref:protein O-GlcNAcase n=1 Tax=Thelohanellus kitauei TaxID=669202 RepID=A0A0C2ND48_THEKT|nr:Protein O-GlcNAcase [Thelohanellus kitauei]